MLDMDSTVSPTFGDQEGSCPFERLQATALVHTCLSSCSDEPRLARTRSRLHVAVPGHVHDPGRSALRSAAVVTNPARSE